VIIINLPGGFSKKATGGAATACDEFITDLYKDEKKPGRRGAPG